MFRFLVGAAALLFLGFGQVMGQDCQLTFNPATDWTYAGRAMNHPFWNTVSNDLCDGMNQSPIDIVTADVLEQPALLDPRMTFSGGYFTKMNGEIGNTGRTLEFTPHADAKPALITGGPLRCKEFRFAQFHFHWGANNDLGSEHTVDGTAYSAEVHLVHYNTAYTNLSQALMHPDGIAVLGFFFQHNTTYPRSDILTRLLSQFYPRRSPVSFRECGDHYNISVSLAEILCNVNDLDKYWTYQGSLTTPTCNEAVTWIVFQDVIKVNGRFEFNRFRALRAFNVPGTSQTDNYRAVQNVNGRVITEPPTTMA